LRDPVQITAKRGFRHTSGLRSEQRFAAVLILDLDSLRVIRITGTVDVPIQDLANRVWQVDLSFSAFSFNITLTVFQRRTFLWIVFNFDVALFPVVMA
jgi:hypothetical protein